MIWCLDVHAPWRCRHTGACCSAGWAIPIEVPAFERITLRFHGRGNGPAFRTGGSLPAGVAAILQPRADGTCVFLESSEDRRCAIHRELGSGSLPIACRQFPRQALKDTRGAFVTLSHYCPTAAALLVDRPSIAIVPAPQNLHLDGDLEGLDATDALPPLLTPDVLTDPDGYDAWERHALGFLAAHPGTADEALAAIDMATTELQRWRPGAGTLVSAAAVAFAEPRTQPVRSAFEDEIARVRLAIASVPADLAPPHPPALSTADWRHATAILQDHAIIVRAYLASRLFGNWIAYHAHGLDTIVKYLRVCLSVLKVETVRHGTASASASRHLASTAIDVRQRLIEAVRATDLLMVHLTDPRALVRRIEAL
jgi:hypothetical protein